ncbi:type II toxin-antitoxin system HipA family toxin [Aeromicrobium panaciterrae]|uniref:type II toxin-antitoxin system HipA family toxin n=1 Tax=Aeromicrobium panaciterrae TaxID=363861 RepID=UPI0031E3553C
MSAAIPLSDEHTLYVVMNGRVVGDINRIGKNRARLRYEDAAAADFTPLSVSMPGPTGRYRETVLVPWVEALLPDRPETLRQWRRRFGVIEPGPLALMPYVGEDVAGAAQFVRPSRLDAVLNRTGEARGLTDDDVAEMLRRAKADLPVSLDESHTGKFSLAGAQAKIALYRTDHGWTDPHDAIPSTHIIKPAIPGMEDQDLVEHVTMRTAAALGLRVARTSIEQFGDTRAVVVQRFDRIQSATGTWSRLHQEDMCQALGVRPSRKYESQGGPGAAVVAQLINEHSTARDVGDNQRFVQALIYNWLVCGTDAHARNYSLMLSGSNVALAPLYDLNSHLAYSDGTGNDLSMSVAGTFRAASVKAADWTREADELFVDPDWLRGEAARQTEQIRDALGDVTKGDDVATYKSPAVRRLVENANLWVKQRAKAAD